MKVDLNKLLVVFPTLAVVISLISCGGPVTPPKVYVYKKSVKPKQLENQAASIQFPRKFSNGYRDTSNYTFARPDLFIKGKCVTPYPNRYMIIIGVYDYKNLPRLNYVINDISLIKRLANCKLGVLKKNIFVLENPTKSHLIKFVKSFVKNVRVNKDSITYIYYSGHGIEDPYGNFFFLTLEADISDLDMLNISSVKLSDIERFIQNIKGDKIFIIDACRTQVTWKSAALVKLSSNIHDQDNKIAYIFSSKPGQPSNISKYGNTSALTMAILELMNHGISNLDFDNSGYVEVKEILSSLKNRLKEVSVDEQDIYIQGSKDVKFIPIF